MSRLRRTAVNVFLILLVGGSVYDIVVDQEHWPFSQYPMFSGIWRSSTFQWYRLVGVREDGREIIFDDRRYIAPFDQSRLHAAFVRLAAGADAVPRLETAVANCFKRYERQRSNGSHDGPALSALRLYLLQWRLDPAAANVDTPDVRTLVAEVDRRALR